MSLNGFNKKKLNCQIIKGRITEINECLLYFKIFTTENRTFRIYVDITKSVPEFPCRDNEIEIINLRKFDARTGVGFIGPKTIFNLSPVLASEIKALELFSCLKVNSIDEDELIAMDVCLQKLESFVPKYILPKCLTTLLYNAPFIIKGVQESAEEHNRSFRKTQIKLPSDLNHVNDNSDLYSFLKFDGMCWYNVYPNRSLQKVTDSYSEYLFGALDVDPVTGYFSLRNNTSEILVKFYETDKNLYTLKNSIVMFKKWTVFTEIFEENSALSLKYILAYVEDVIVIESMSNSKEQRLFYRKNEVWHIGKRKTIFLQTLKISEVIYGYNKRPECWIEAVISEKDGSFSSKRMVYVVLTNKHITIVPFLKEHAVYQILYYEEPTFSKLDSYRELNRIKKTNDVCKIGHDAIFQESDISPIPENNLSLEEFQDVEQFMKSASPNRMFSCCLKISKKELKDNSNYPSWIPKRHENANFGTQGKNIQMRLTFMNPANHSYIDLYMADRDNVVTPLGLVDDMIVRVKNVQIFKNKYIKTNILSSFELVEYCPELVFSSVNMFFTDKSTWRWREQTPATALGMFSNFPRRCIVHGTFIFQAVGYLKITPVCDGCKQPSVPEMLCRRCDISDRDLNIEMSICASDFINATFFMNTQNKHLFFELMGLRNGYEVKTFCSAFYKVPVVKINFCKIEEFQIFIKDPESKAFVDQIVNLIKSQINFNLFTLVDAVCMKQPGERQWKIIDFTFIC